MQEKEILKSNSVKQLAMSVGYYTAASIFGPLFLFGGIGFFLDKIFDSKPFILIIGIFIAFISTNFMIYKKVRKMMKSFDVIEKNASGNESKTDINK